MYHPCTAQLARCPKPQSDPQLTWGIQTTWYCCCINKVLDIKLLVPLLSTSMTILPCMELSSETPRSAGGVRKIYTTKKIQKFSTLWKRRSMPSEEFHQTSARKSFSVLPMDQFIPFSTLLTTEQMALYQPAYFFFFFFFSYNISDFFLPTHHW